MAGEHAVGAVAPASIGNFGPGLDVLGCALAGPGDEVIARVVTDRGVRIDDAGHPELPTDAARHASGIAADAVLRAARSLGITAPGGVALTVRKRLPLAGGQGGSAASAVAAAAAVNALLASPLDRATLLAACLTAEATVAGRHLDNIAPCLLGGIVLVRSLDPIDVVPLPVPEELTIVIAHPDQRLMTREARDVLPREVSRTLLLHQTAQVGAVVAALYEGDLALLGRALDDRVAEPARAPLLRGFAEAKHAALEAGALGASISGAGPSSFALADSAACGERVAAAMRAGYARCGVACTVRVTRPGAGTRLFDPAEGPPSDA